MIEFKVLAENRSSNTCLSEEGLSLYINRDNDELLMDTGCSNLYLDNARKLGVDLDKVKNVVISHGHNDHSGGIRYLANNKTIYLHPSIYKKRYSMRRKIETGFPISREYMIENYNVIESKEAISIYYNIYFLGEIPMITSHEKDGNFATMLDSELTEVDYTEDDTGIAIKCESGLVVITGCGQRRICNTIEHAKKVTGENKLYAVFGGLHLRNLEKQKEMIDCTIEYFKKNNLKYLFLGHCVSDEVIEYFKKNLEDSEIISIYSGMSYKLK